MGYGSTFSSMSNISHGFFREDVMPTAKTQGLYNALYNAIPNSRRRTITSTTSLEVVDSDMIALVLHDTDIIRVFKNDSIILHVGRFYSKTSRQKMNVLLQCIEANVYQKNYDWYLAYNGKVYDFKNGMIIDTVNKTVSY